MINLCPQKEIRSSSSSDIIMSPTQQSSCTIHNLGVIRTTRDVPPADYKFKIEKFSLLSNVLMVEKKEKYESGSFEAGGYKWRLCIYPNGDNKTSVGTCISVYLILAESNCMPIGSEVIVDFKFFVYDQIRDNYLTVEDADERVKRFHKLKNAHGISNLISLDLFYDASNGYLVDDSCVFGVELLVIKNTNKADCLSFTKIPDLIPLVHTWKIDNFSKRKTEFFSPVFTMAGRKWKLEINSRWNEKWLGLGVLLADTNCKTLSGFIRWLRKENEQNLYAVCDLRVKDQLYGQHKEEKEGGWFNHEIAGWGYGDLIPLTELYDQSKGFLVNDVLIVEVQFTHFLADKNIS